MQSKAPTVAAYIAELPPEKRTVIKTLDGLIRSHLRGAVGTMKYGMPTYEISGPTIALNAQKNYFALYMDPSIVKRYRAQLKGLDCGKCCIRFRRLEEIPLKTVGRMVAEHRPPRPKKRGDPQD